MVYESIQRTIDLNAKGKTEQIIEIPYGNHGTEYHSNKSNMHSKIENINKPFCNHKSCSLIFL